MKLGLGESYDRVSILPEKFRAYIDLTKPASSLGVGFAFLLGSLFYFYYNNDPSGIWLNSHNIIYALITVILSHGASQALNMSEDADIDAQTEHKKNRPIPSGVVSTEEARTIAWILILFSVGRAYLVSTMFGVFVSVGVFMGIFYNLEPIRAKKRRISVLWQAVSRGMLLFPSIWAAYGNPWKPLPWILSIFMFLYVMSYQNTADIADRHVDEKHGIKTFVVMFGIRGTGYIAAFGTLMMTLTILTSIYIGVLPGRLIWMLAIIPLCILMLYYMILRPEHVSERTGNSPAYLYYYLGMVVCVAIPDVVEMLH